jgi:hypothetical protein
LINKAIFICLLFVFISVSGFAQQPKPCSDPNANQFDFWLGEWQATWKDSTQASGEAHATNNISKILGGCVIFEQFNSPALMGKSHSVYNIRTGKWHQTWVDNQGAYLDFIGEWEGDKMILSRSVEIKGKKVMQRMVWHNISPEAFDWNWEGSKDTGKTWNVNWQIRYTRK